jgi:hypothetical protein
MNRSIPLLTILAAVGLVACAEGPTPPEALISAEAAPLQKGSPSPQVNRDLADLRRATAAFQQHGRAVSAGYSIQFPEGCMESSQGGQGYHYLNGDLVGTLDITQPQLLMYEPQPNGRLSLVGVEYIFPGAPDDDPPVLFERDFVWSEAYEVWLLHVWAWRGNPDSEAGTFANWNRLVSCRHAVAHAPASALHH